MNINWTSVAKWGTGLVLNAGWFYLVVTHQASAADFISAVVAQLTGLGVHAVNTKPSVPPSNSGSGPNA